MIKAIIFDVDGVLLDSYAANFEWFGNLLKKVGYQPPTKEAYRPLFHRTLKDALGILAGTKDEAEIKRISDFMDVIPSQPPIMSDGAPETIKALSEKYLLAIVTSRIKAYAYEAPLDSLKPYFQATVVYEDTENHKPHPEPLLLAAEQLGAQPDECVYVGDVASDMEAANAAGMLFILYSQEEVAGAIVRTSDFAELPGLIETFQS